MNVLLPMIVSELADTADFALARIWLTETQLTDRQQRVLKLSASAGRSRVERGSWKNLDGEFSSIPWGALKVGHIAKNSESLHLDEHEIKHSRWTIHPEWIAREGINGFAGHPLVFRGKVLGVLGVFSRNLISQQQFRWLRLFADQAAVAIATAPSFSRNRKSSPKIAVGERGSPDGGEAKPWWFCRQKPSPSKGSRTD